MQHIKSIYLARDVKKRRKKEKPERMNRIFQLENWWLKRVDGGESAYSERVEEGLNCNY